jgi:hypothetical protein
MNESELALLEAVELLRKAKVHVARDMSIGGQQCSTEICEFLSRVRTTFLALQAKQLETE